MKGWEFQPARDRELHGLERHRSLQREHGLGASVCRLIWWSVVRLSFRVWNRVRVTGYENLPAKPPFVLISNHTSHLDAPLLASLLPAKWRDQVSPVAASDTFFERRPTAAFAASFLNAIAIRRQGTGSHDLAQMRARLADGSSILIIFPEGTRSRTGELQAFKSGLGRLVAGSDVPVVPCHLDGCFRACPPGARWVKPVRINVKIGRPLSFEDCPDSRSGWDTVARRLREALEELSH